MLGAFLCTHMLAICLLIESSMIISYLRVRRMIRLREGTHKNILEESLPSSLPSRSAPFAIMDKPWVVESNVTAAFSFIAFVLCYIPLAWHLHCEYSLVFWRGSWLMVLIAWNVACLLYIFWTGTQCLFQFVNLLIWRDNAINSAPIWCEICTPLYQFPSDEDTQELPFSH